MTTIAPVNAPFLANMTQLWRRDARLAQKIDELPFDASLAVQPSKAGPPTASVTTADGRAMFLHSRYDPVREAVDFCKSIERTDASAVILCGLGLGYHLKALFETLGDDITVLVGEPDLVTIKTALEHTDLSCELATGRVEIFTSLDKGSLHDRLQRHSTILMLGTLFAVPPAYRDHGSEWQSAFRQAITDFAAFAKMSLVTLVRNAGITCRNIANNLPTYLSTPPADILRGRFAGCPAILVAAGPSLAKNIDQLHALQDKAVIIAAQTTLKPLLARGIRPHFVTSLDFSEISRQFFEGVEMPKGVVLVAEPKATWHVVDAFRGSDARRPNRVILLDNEFAHRCVGTALAQRTPMEAGATVMHLAFYLAQWLGCDPIIFIGQDLGFTGHTYYTPGVAIHRAWRAECGRFSTLEMKEWERIVRHRPILRKATDIDGRDIYTDEQMFTYQEQFERDFARSTATIIDATEGGVRKQGAEITSLAKAAAIHCARPIEPRLFDYLSIEWESGSRLRAGREALVERVRMLAEFRALCEETKSILRELHGLTREPAKFNKRLVRVDELRTLVHKHDLIFTMVRDVSQMGELQRYAADRRLAGEELNDTQRAQSQLRRDEQFMDALLEGCSLLQQILDESLARFDRAIEATS
ncbi:MAG: 6-hydroxymethylpterin diphosphokinase MptE-like protein [Planctomycetota bacterium]